MYQCRRQKSKGSILFTKDVLWSQGQQGFFLVNEPFPAFPKSMFVYSPVLCAKFFRPERPLTCTFNSYSADYEHNTFTCKRCVWDFLELDEKYHSMGWALEFHIKALKLFGYLQ